MIGSLTLLIFAMAMAAWGREVLVKAPSSMQEMLGMVMILIAAVFFAASVLVAEVNYARRMIIAEIRRTRSGPVGRVPLASQSAVEAQNISTMLDGTDV